MWMVQFLELLAQSLLGASTGCRLFRRITYPCFTLLDHFDHVMFTPCGLPSFITLGRQ